MAEGRVNLKEDKNDHLVQKLYKTGLHHFKEPQPLKMNAPKG